MHASGFARESRVGSRRTVTVGAYNNGRFEHTDDVLAVERALEIHVAGRESIVTMCTPGNDRELVIGLMHSEGIIEHRDEIVHLGPSGESADVMRLILGPTARTRFDATARNTFATSACGVCGTPHFSPPRRDRGQATPKAPQTATLTPATLLSLPARLRDAQQVFEATGGLHAAGLFTLDGELIATREDVGRHNALDKLIGWAFTEDRLPLIDSIVMLSGRASFELLQKSIAAGATAVCAVSAPSSYAVTLARQFDTTLVGFLRDGRFNVYSAGHRIVGAPQTVSGHT